jgi:hypothetical protein
MVDLDAGALFSVKGLIAVITGGGTGKNYRHGHVRILTEL